MKMSHIATAETSRHKEQRLLMEIIVTLKGVTWDHIYSTRTVYLIINQLTNPCLGNPGLSDRNDLTW